MRIVDDIEPRFIRVEAAVRQSGISKRTIYDLMNRGAFTAVRSGHSLLIDLKSWTSYLDNLPRYVPGRDVTAAKGKRAA
jgi:hypothetical protein